ncbi:sigma-70 family RNA polymerase sigma factor [Ruminococcaceae bacterium OttesenSCG-928-L11]|nr:sigma-70 family RNA polymerase sigma factor [Ruminococcaceae bacterium OttesenSCG-928-L11]
MAMAELWDNTRWLIHKLMSRYFPLCPRYGLEVQDLKQEEYLAMMKAVEAFDPDRGLKFNSYLHFSVQAAVHGAFGHRSGKASTVRLVSINELVAGSDDFTIGDTLEDETASAEMENVVEGAYHKQFVSCLEECMKGMLPRYADVIRARYLEGKTIKQLADEMGVTAERVRQIEGKALRKLRHPLCSRQLQSFLYYDDVKGSGFRAFRDRGYVSKVEVMAGTK